MKQKFNILTLLAVLCLGATACNDDDSVFESSAADRIKEGVARYDRALLEGGTWIMEYFPSQSIKYGGWMYVLRFNEDHTVRAWFEGSTFTDDKYVETPYAVEYSTGPMLKFTNHNDYLHFFSFPGDNGAGYQGYEGDYEFTLMSQNEASEIIMRGIKTRNDIRLRPLPEEYSPEVYVEAVRESQRRVKPTTLKLMVNGKQYGTLTRENALDETDFRRYYASKLWTLSYTRQVQSTDPTGAPIFDEAGNPVYESVQVNDQLAFIHYPDNTMKLYKPYTFRCELEGLPDQTIQTLAWREGEVATTSHFVCTDSFLEIRFEQ